MLTICLIIITTLFLILFKSNRFELMIVSLMRKTKLESLEWISVYKPLFWPNHYIGGFISENIRAILFDYKRIGFSKWISNWINNSTYALEFNLCGSLEGLKYLKSNQGYIKKVTSRGVIDYRFMLEFPKVTLSLTSIMSSVCHCYPQLMALSSCMKKRFGSVSFKQKYGEEKSLNFIIKKLLFRHLCIDLESFGFDVKEDIHRLNQKMKNRSIIEYNLPQKYTPQILNHNTNLYL